METTTVLKTTVLKTTVLKTTVLKTTVLKTTVSKTTVLNGHGIDRTLRGQALFDIWPGGETHFPTLESPEAVAERVAAFVEQEHR